MSQSLWINFIFVGGQEKRYVTRTKLCSHKKLNISTDAILGQTKSHPDYPSINEAETTPKEGNNKSITTEQIVLSRFLSKRWVSLCLKGHGPWCHNGWSVTLVLWRLDDGLLNYMIRTEPGARGRRRTPFKLYLASSLCNNKAYSH